MTQQKKQRIIIGISGASGIVYSLCFLEKLRQLSIETHLVISSSAERTLAYETNKKLKDIIKMADFYYRHDDIGAAISSGSFLTMGMIIAPCSVRSMSEIATGVTSNLLTRAADVCLKERRKLVLLVRETPLHSGHLRTMLTLSDMGAIIAPPVPAFYAKPKNLDDMVEHTVGRVGDLFDLEFGFIRRWGEEKSLKKRSDN
ncbi:MAG: UbiX family flavin prenyltransferase [Alphaproteobacteria bacterium]|nr:UbiX family flavin prenyltransferase [Alphaproteobacteria bacterium]